MKQEDYTYISAYLGLFVAGVGAFTRASEIACPADERLVRMLIELENKVKAVALEIDGCRHLLPRDSRIVNSPGITKWPNIKPPTTGEQNEA